MKLLQGLGLGMALWSASARATAQPVVVGEPPPPLPRTVISTNPLGMLVGTLNVELEQVVMPTLSLFVGPQVQFSQGIGSSPDRSVWGVGAVGGLRFYPWGLAPKGLYLSPQLSLAYASVTSGSVEGSGTGFSVAGMVGYQWIIGRHFALALAGGVQYLSVSAEASSGTSSAALSTSGIYPALRLGLGLAF